MKTYHDLLLETPSIPARVEAPRRLVDDLDIKTLTERALTAQDAATHAQREADSLRSALFLRRRQRLAAGEPVPAAAPLTALPRWDDQRNSERIAFENAERDAGRYTR